MPALLMVSTFESVFRTDSFENASVFERFSVDSFQTEKHLCGRGVRIWKFLFKGIFFIIWQLFSWRGPCSFKFITRDVYILGEMPGKTTTPYKDLCISI